MQLIRKTDSPNIWEMYLKPFRNPFILVLPIHQFCDIFIICNILGCFPHCSPLKLRGNFQRHLQICNKVNKIRIIFFFFFFNNNNKKKILCKLHACMHEINRSRKFRVEETNYVRTLRFMQRDSAKYLALKRCKICS